MDAQPNADDERLRRIAGGGGFSPKLPVVLDHDPTAPVMISVDDLPDAKAISFGDGSGSIGPGYGWGGGKYPGSLPAGFGFNYDYEIIDLPLLRRRSKLLFQRNLFAAGLVRRLVTNEINKGLTPQATPVPSMIGMEEQEAYEWSDQVEERFNVYCNDPVQVDYHRQMTFGEIQMEARRIAILEGDCLVIERVNRRTGIPNYELIPGTNICNSNLQGVDETIIQGVEVDANYRHIAYHVTDFNTGKTTRVPAYGRTSGRRVAWMVYGSDQRFERVRGVPLLGICIQSLNELDTYRDGELRASTLNSFIAVYMKKDTPAIGSGALSEGAVKRDAVTGEIDNGQRPRQFTSAEYLPGMMMTELQAGEEPKSFDTKRPNVNYHTFETGVLSAIAWANEVPPEILLMQFSHNYSASKAATSEFTLYLDRIRSVFSAQLNKRVYQSWLLGEALMGRLIAPGLLDSFRDPLQRPIYAAWVSSDWIGAIKPSVDLLKDVRAYAEACDEGFVDRETASMQLFGRSNRTVTRNLKRQNVGLAEAREPLIQVERSELPDEDESGEGNEQ